MKNDDFKIKLEGSINSKKSDCINYEYERLDISQLNLIKKKENIKLNTHYKEVLSGSF